MISFCIITSNDKYNALSRVVDSINSLNIPDREILICGGNKKFDGTKHLDFDESKYPNKIGFKKNLLNAASSNDVNVFIHDYIQFDPDWWNGYKEFGFDWDISISPIVRLNGTRGADWIASSFRPANKGRFSNCHLIDYSDSSAKDCQYIPGNYWLSKKYVLEADPIDSSLSAGQMEDVEWSCRVLEKYSFVLNPLSKVRELRVL